jgi:hypothetical protein
MKATHMKKAVTPCVLFVMLVLALAMGSLQMTVYSRE